MSGITFAQYCEHMKGTARWEMATREEKVAHWDYCYDTVKYDPIALRQCWHSFYAGWRAALTPRQPESQQP